MLSISKMIFVLAVVEYCVVVLGCIPTACYTRQDWKYLLPILYP